MAQARIMSDHITILTSVALLINSAPSAQAQLSPACSVNNAKIVTSNFATKDPAGTGNFIYQTSQIPSDAVIVSPSAAPGVVEYPPIGEVCYSGSSTQTNPFDIACVPSEINGILSMADPDAGMKMYAPD
jgi:hypothetical protein